jgi:sucrose-phosphate synthase
VFVGGNVEHPDPVERTMLEHIDRIMETHRELHGRFCHIPAQPNPKVRLLEQSIVDAISGPCPNVYVCSSFKEEFGISILEAMASGFLAIAPRNGGVYSYMENGTTGFLIQTDTSEALRTDLEAVLDPARNPGERLLSIARQGRHMVHDTFDINRIAEDFSNYYRLFLEGSVQP